LIVLWLVQQATAVGAPVALNKQQLSTTLGISISDLEAALSYLHLKGWVQVQNINQLSSQVQPVVCTTGTSQQVINLVSQVYRVVASVSGQYPPDLVNYEVHVMQTSQPGLQGTIQPRILNGGPAVATPTQHGSGLYDLTTNVLNEIAATNATTSPVRDRLDIFAV